MMNEMPTFQEEKDYIQLLETLIKVAEAQKSLSVATMKLIMVAMANIIKAYCQMFVKSKDIIQKDEDSGFVLELFSRMSFKHSVIVISDVVNGIKIKESRTTTEGRQFE
ncbi:MAG: hypothetical protein E3K37_02790 [Candidatus Kuenenia sp.]|nr:hypothetical protein [Candidatus Kuenenia hertensis]